MGPFPHDAEPPVIDDANPMGTDGFEFVEFCHPNPAELDRLFTQMGFSAVARHRTKNVTLYRIESFVIGSFIMGVGGAIYAHYVVSIDYSHFNPLFATFIVWVMLMLGGSGNNKGAILGAFVVWGVWTGTAFLVEAVTPALRVISDDLPSRGAYLRWMLVAILLAAIVLFRPQGLIRERSRVSDFMPEEDSRD